MCSAKRDPVRLSRLVARAGGEHDEAGDRLRLRHRKGQHTASFDSEWRSKTPIAAGYRGTCGRREDAGAPSRRSRSGWRASPSTGDCLRVAWPWSAAVLLPRSTDERQRGRCARSGAVAAGRRRARARQPRGETPLTLEAHAFAGAKWLVTGKSDGPIVSLCDRWSSPPPRSRRAATRRPTPRRRNRSIGAREDVSWLSGAVAARLAGERFPSRSTGGS